ncbi:MAG: hypothetical protein LBH73_01410 [Spirochaetaceae bacterium]|nr:hypothetical protein [Spirochaetaceae bacterium]
MLFVLLICAVLFSCGSLPFNLISARGWPASEGPDPSLPRLSIGEVSVDRAGDYRSVEAELALLLPLLLAERGFTVVAPEEGPDFIVRGRAVEREYLKNWRTVRSVSAELYFYPKGKEALPYASGRASASGTRSLASSQDMEALFRSALGRLIGAMEKR